MYKNNLNNLRMSNNKTKEDMAKLLKMDRTTYTNYESEKDLIPIKHLNTLCNYFNVSIDYILGLSNTINYPNSNKDIDTSKTIIRLKTLRKENNLTQAKLASILNSANTTISGYELGTRIIATPFLYTICSKFNISADYLLGKIDIPKYLK